MMLSRSASCLLGILYIAVQFHEGAGDETIVKVNQGDPASLDCAITRDIPKNQTYTITWFLKEYETKRLFIVANRTGDNEEVFADWIGNVTLLTNGTLDFSITEFKRDNSEYVCEVNGTLGYFESMLAGLRVQGPIHLPDVGGLQNTIQFVTEGQKVFYRCSAHGGNYPLPFIKWLDLKQGMGGGSIECDNTNYQTFKCSFSLRFTITVDMEGYEFRCQATYGLSILEQSFRLQVSYPPRVDISMFPSNNVTNGTNVMFSCNVHSSPPSMITWYGYRFPGGGTNYHYHSFTLANVTYADGGYWSCEADNGYGKVRINQLLNVKTVYPTPTAPPLTTTRPPGRMVDGYGVSAVIIAALCLAGIVATTAFLALRRKGRVPGEMLIQ